MFMYLLGAVLALVFLKSVHVRGASLRSAAAVVLVVAALVYVGVAVAACTSQALFTELVGVGLFAALAWAGVRWHPGFLLLGWLAHPVWDGVFHLMTRTCTPGVVWYAQLCVGFDLVVAVVLAGRLRRPRPG